MWIDEKMREAGKLSTLIGTRNQMGATSLSCHKMAVKRVQKKGANLIDSFFFFYLDDTAKPSDLLCMVCKEEWV